MWVCQRPVDAFCASLALTLTSVAISQADTLKH